MAKSNIINIMLRPKGYPNKITPEVKDKLQLIIDDLILALDSDEYTGNQRIKMPQVALQHTLPKMR